MPRRKFGLLVSLVLLFALAVSVGGQTRSPQNIILLIGDGMGIGAVSAAKVAAGQLNLERFPHTALAMTFPLGDDLVTDSAAGATALATGYKTLNGWLSLAPSATSGKFDTLKTVLEFAEQAGKSTGLVATSRITHATPAGFATHSQSRGGEPDLAIQISQKGIEVLFGGGRDYFLPTSEPEGKRGDGLNLVAQMQQKGYQYLTSEKELSRVEPNPEVKVLGLFAAAAMDVAEVRKPTLTEMTGKAIAILSQNPKGFFLMIEGSQIDWKAHDKNSAALIAEAIDFDRAVGVALNFAEKNGKTLVVATADHETGGYAVLGGLLAKQEVKGGFVTGGHTANFVPVFAFGPGAVNFRGIIDNTFIGKRLIEFVGQ